MYMYMYTIYMYIEIYMYRHTWQSLLKHQCVRILIMILHDQPEVFVLSGRKYMLSCGVYIHVVDGGLAYDVVTALE